MKLPFIFLATAAAVSPIHAFLLMGKLSGYERMDPIVQPGVVSAHVHAVIGNSNFRQTFNANTWDKANCSTMEIQENKSNYWVPSLFGVHDNGTFSAIPVTEVRIYYLNNASRVMLKLSAAAGSD
jgi:Domain of unknown function (DUF1996)